MRRSDASNLFFAPAAETCCSLEARDVGAAPGWHCDLRTSRLSLMRLGVQACGHVTPTLSSFYETVFKRRTKLWECRRLCAGDPG